MEKQNTRQSETTTSFTVDADDLCEGNDGLMTLLRIKGKNPDFKITLFTIVGRCSRAWLGMIKGADWIRMVPHGWMHTTSREC